MYCPCYLRNVKKRFFCWLKQLVKYYKRLYALVHLKNFSLVSNESLSFSLQYCTFSLTTMSSRSLPLTKVIVAKIKINKIKFTWAACCIVACEGGCAARCACWELLGWPGRLECWPDGFDRLIEPCWAELMVSGI